MLAEPRRVDQFAEECLVHLLGVCVVGSLLVVVTLFVQELCFLEHVADIVNIAKLPQFNG